MGYHIIVYCPDRHITYDGTTPDREGVGGGITSRVRLASALAKRGHTVEVICNCDSVKTIAGVRYVPLDSVTSLTGDVLIVNSSGGAYDLSPIEAYSVDVELKVLWVSGVAQPRGIDSLSPDLICAKSNFLRVAIRERWGIADIPVFVIYNGYPEELFEAIENVATKDPYRVVYASHPDKGLQEAINVVSELRQHDRRYHLEVLGSEALWGQAERTKEPSPGVRFIGTVPQAEVASSLRRATFSLCLQAIEEGFGLTVLESMRSGCVTIASFVGAYPELISDHCDGILIEDHYQSEAALRSAVNHIRHLNDKTRERNRIQVRASRVPWSWGLIAHTWEQLIDMELWNGRSQPRGLLPAGGQCAGCSSETRLFADGWHCLECGSFSPIRE